MHDTGNITGFRICEAGTELKIFIPKRNLQEAILSRQIKQVGLWLEDGRHITAEQRKKAYATIKDISECTGYLPEEAKEYMKYYHMIQTGCKYFSLSDCCIETAKEFINTLIEFALKYGVILSDSAIERTDDINRYIFMCLKYKKCAICGRPGEIHHWDAIGMGNDRMKFDDSEYRKICLCRLHHTEVHQMGREKFSLKYKVYGIKIGA